MTPSLTSKCRRATYRHLYSHNDALQFPEALLTAIFERYYVILRTVARHGSSVPGPMENRRRMGKRQMAELNLGQSHPASPLWAFENLPDLTKWKWKPPSPPDALNRQVQAQNVERRGMVRSILNWVVGRPAPALAPTTAPTSDMALDDAEGHSTHTPEITEQHLQRMIWDSQTSPLVVIETGLNHLFQDLSSDITTTIRPNFTEFCGVWRESLANGFFSGDAIRSVLDGIQNGLAMLQSDTVQPLERTVADQIMLSLLTASISGLSNNNIYKSKDFDLFVWNDILQRISKLHMNTLRVLAAAMANIPDHHLGDIAADTLKNLNVYLLASAHERKRSSVIRQAGKMAKALMALDPAIHIGIFESGTQCVLDHMALGNLNYRRIRYGWLQLLVRIPGLEFDYLTKVCSILEAGKSGIPLLNRELCELYITSHISTLNHETKLRNTLRENIHGNDDRQFYGLFSLALWQTGQFNHVQDFCRFLEKLGRSQDIVLVVKGLRNLVKNNVMPLVNLASGAHQPILALEIMSLYEQSRRLPGGFWGSKYANKVLKLLARVPFLRHIEVLRALRIRCHVRKRRRTRYKLARTSLILQATAAAKMVAASPTISHRASLTLITQIINHLQRFSGAVVPPTVLQILLHIITRDLALGLPGRTSRIRWLLGLLHKHISRDKMVRIGLAIREWRQLNWEKMMRRRSRERVG
ncbi:hypothetical protein F5B19DRAFT_463401 [Rostrohypoxylon terebratum]|nr:hypothetical protein F5B19DRAFT_463401 [Rostrohypoxylon terebratum]